MAVGGEGVEELGPGLVLRVSALPPGDEVRVGDDRAADGHSVDERRFEELGRALGGDGGGHEAAVDDQLAAEVLLEFLNEVAGGLGVEHRQVGQAERAQLVEEVAVGGLDVVVVGLSDATPVPTRRLIVFLD